MHTGVAPARCTLGPSRLLVDHETVGVRLPDNLRRYNGRCIADGPRAALRRLGSSVMRISDDLLRNCVRMWDYIVNEKRKGLEPEGAPRGLVTTDDASFALTLAVVAVIAAQDRGSLDDEAAGIIKVALLAVREYIRPLPPYMLNGEDNVGVMLRDMVEELRLDQIEIATRQRERDDRKGESGPA